MEESSQFHTLATLSPVKQHHCLKDWVDPKASLYAVGMREVPAQAYNIVLFIILWRKQSLN
jgi:hypothetical protein